MQYRREQARVEAANRESVTNCGENWTLGERLLVGRRQEHWRQRKGQEQQGHRIWRGSARVYLGLRTPLTVANVEKPGHCARDCRNIAIDGEGETGADDWTWNAQHWMNSNLDLKLEENHWKTWVTILVLKGLLGNTFAKTTVAPVQKNFWSVCSIGGHWTRSHIQE